MFKNPKTTLIIVVVSIVLLVMFFPTFGINTKEIKDTNGSENFSLCEITDEDILEGIDGDLTEINVPDSEYYHFYGKLFSGAESVYTFDKSKSSYTVEVSKIEVTEGNMRVVVVVDDVIVNDFTPNVPNQNYTISNFSESASIRIAGESAICELKFKVK